MSRELRVFLVVGGLTVLVDFVVYRSLLSWMALPVSLSKTLGFVSGMLFAYVANRRWTFGHVGHRKGSAWRFMLVYVCNLAMNVAVNALVLLALAGWPAEWSIAIAFVVATGVSATLNFAGMKWFVFAAPSHKTGEAI